MSKSTDIVVIAREIATAAHRGQFRRGRDGKPNLQVPYIFHPSRIACDFDLAGDIEAAAVAWCHDVLEECHPEWTVERLREEGLPSDVVAAIAVLTKYPDESYEDYLIHVKANALARRVKIRDMLDNLGDHPTDNQIRKYAKGLLFLID